MTQKKLIVIVTAAAAAVAALVFILSAVLRKGSEPEQQSQSSDNSYSASDENGGSSYSEPNSSETGSTSDTSSSSSNVSETGSTSSDISSASSTAPEASDAPDSTSSDTSELPDSSGVQSSEPSEETSDNSPQWTETEISAELYVNTNNIWSRAYAIQGSDTVKQYGLNDKVTVTAKTDTDYYKLDDGTFIHCDYLSENEVKPHYGGLEDYTALTPNGYTIERINSITYVDGIMIANKTYTLPSNYDPGTMPDAYNAFVQMRDAAELDGISLFIVSGYRSYDDQDAIYARYAYNDGAEVADTYSSRPGHSDHQTGYTFDLNSLEQSFADTAEGIWLAGHCAEYGFIIRYPKGKDAYTGYMYEPWHVRYIGVEKAKAITESGLSLEEYYGITSDYAYCQDE